MNSSSSITRTCSKWPQETRRICGSSFLDLERTVTVITDGGQRWNVSPGFLKKAAAAQQGASGSAVVQISERKGGG